MGMVNLKVREFSQAIINFINQSPLPIEVKRLCMSDIATQLQHTADEQIKAELLERSKQTGDDNPGQEEKNEFAENP